MSDIDFYYKVRARYGQDWRLHNTVRMEISIGQNQHEGKKLAAAFSWAIKNFDHIITLVADSQQRFDLMFEGLSEADACKKSLASGDAWIERNATILDYPEVQIVRWDEIKAFGGWDVLREKVEELYYNDSAFKERVDEGIFQHWKRQNHSKSLFEQYFHFSRLYAFEEISVLAMAYKTFGGISAYPGTLDFSKAMYECATLPSAPDGFKCANFTSLCFERRQAA